MQIPDVREDVMRDVIRSEDKGEVQTAMAKMDYEDREIIRLKFFEELSNIEIAEVMGLSANHIGVKVFRALKKFKQLISQ
jgi:RNA polymerase sigma-70 factor (ECF subfamily)